MRAIWSILSPFKSWFTRLSPGLALPLRAPHRWDRRMFRSLGTPWNQLVPSASRSLVARCRSRLTTISTTRQWLQGWRWRIMIRRPHRPCIQNAGHHGVPCACLAHACWVPAPEPAAPPLRAHVAASELERFDIADGPATEDPYGTPIGSGRSESSTPRRWLMNTAGAFDDSARRQHSCSRQCFCLSRR